MHGTDVASEIKKSIPIRFKGMFVGLLFIGRPSGAALYCTCPSGAALYCTCPSGAALYCACGVCVCHCVRVAVHHECILYTS